MASIDVYRAPMPSAVERALSVGVVGMGEATDERSQRRLNRFVAVPEGSFVWTRDRNGNTYVGRITGPWRRGEADLTNVRDTEWITVPVDPALVPAAVAQTFARGGRNFQRIHPSNVEAETAQLWERLTQ